ncbi:Uncharacterized conserved protein [Peptoclostridium litorale DSM 5388]|uniref:Schlafen group 3-like DNA/RNA helicase domain-containing protein n=1 Tax=Peptoclostridium litorale DSM 5388 TaxID=1121324 RepID=A0A069RFV9_PEPLI|nr:DUF2075 domain-containing protein [Peptoclostridium litorale]KDR95070.1 hypothetical protein CLIT_11c00990 [Peptoclostridium litorale DSM 5388]SIN75510.1 Uncharacterized conserved protein [Peptoclostridium litorale DSM 5388]
MQRSYYSKDVENFIHDEESYILGELTRNHEFALEDLQRNAWISEIRILKSQFGKLENAHVLFEYSIPRMGKRVDTVAIYKGIVFLLEFKVNESRYTRYAIDQVLDYAVDLKNFHEESHDLCIVPVVVSTEAQTHSNGHEKYSDDVYKPLLCNRHNIASEMESIAEKEKRGDLKADKWENSVYKPTPTIIEAAQALYRGHSVKEISRSDSGALNLGKTAREINGIIEHSKKHSKKSICFVTGVPGAGKTLAGLNIANERHDFEQEEHAVFLSGNGPLVEVLQEALARNEVEHSCKKVKKTDALRRAKSFIQNIHHFRDAALKDSRPQAEKVVIFDEAQRAWTKEQTSQFMSRKKGIPDFNKSEPDFLISILDRHEDWSVIICLIGGGQEINTGEAGLSEWFNALRKNYPHWDVYISSELKDSEYTQGLEFNEFISGINYVSKESLHLSTSVRSFRSEDVSSLVKNILDGNQVKAGEIYRNVNEKYPIYVTRSLDKARGWLNLHQRGNGERTGIVASSGAYRLKPYGVNIKSKIDSKNWFLSCKEDVRSSFYLEDVATEFDIQGLELDWVCVAWDADLRRADGVWQFKKFRGTNWQSINKDESKMYLKNAYRVLLTRARQGMVIFIPNGCADDYTRQPGFYDETYEYLKGIGISEI